MPKGAAEDTERDGGTDGIEQGTNASARRRGGIDNRKHIERSRRHGKREKSDSNVVNYNEGCKSV